MKNLISYALILIGGIIAIYTSATEQQNVWILVFGIVLLMLGVYRLNAGITSKVESNRNYFTDEEE